MYLRCLLPVVSLLLSPFAAARADTIPLQELLNYFSATCRSYGEFSAAALGRADTIASTLRKMKADDDCDALTSAQSQLIAIQNSIATLTQLDASAFRYINYRTQEQTILAALATATDPQIISSLNDQLVEVTHALARTRPMKDQTQIASMVESTEQVLQASANSFNCFIKRPGLLAEVAALSSSVGASAMAFNPALGTKITAGAALLGRVLQQIRNLKFARAGRDLGNIKRAEALSCVLESLTTDYCEADTTLRMIDWKLKHMDLSQYGRTTLDATVRMMDRDVPALLKWVESLRGSTKAATLADAARVANINDRETKLRNTELHVGGYFGDKAYILSGYTEYYARWSYFKSNIQALLGFIGVTYSMSNNSSTTFNPMMEIYGGDVALYYAIGITQDKIPVLPAMGRMSFDQFDPKTAYLNDPRFPGGWPPGVPDLRDIKNLQFQLVQDQLSLWITETRKIINAERTRFAYPDLRGIFQRAFDAEAETARYPVSPYEALASLIELTRSVIRESRNAPEFRSFFEDTLKRLTDIEIELLKFKDPSQAPTDAQLPAILDTIFTNAKLENGTLFFTSRLETLIRYAYVNLLRKPQNDNDRRAYAEALAARRFTEVFESKDPTKTLTAQREDVDGSKGTYQSTLEIFVKHFQKEIAESLEEWIEMERKTQDASYRNKRTKLCLNLLQVAEWPSRIPFSYCEGLEGRLIFVDSPIAPRAPVITEKLADKPLAERSCLLRNLRRDTDIYERRKQFDVELNKMPANPKK